jgi:hypothetical protein
MTDQHTHAVPHAHEHEHDGDSHVHPHTTHVHNHVEHEHQHEHAGETHTHAHVHQDGIEAAHEPGGIPAPAACRMAGVGACSASPDPGALSSETNQSLLQLHESF